MRSEDPDLLSLALTALPHGRFLIGVSGGMDSMALLDAVTAAGEREFVVCHLDHALRPESAADAEFVAAMALRLGCAAYVERADVLALATSGKESIETAGRRCRLEMFARAAAAYSCRRVLLAHHADDLVETFLFNLMRGSGGAGLRGMRGQTCHRVGDIELELHRPLLGISRSDIAAYIEKHAVPFREDTSNFESTYTRNRVRHELLPVLEKVMGRDVRAAIRRSAAIMDVEQDWIESLLPSHLYQLPELPVTEVRALHQAGQRRVIQGWLKQQGVPDVSFDDVELVRAMLHVEKPAKVNLAGGIHARRRAGKLFLERPA